MTVAAAPLLLDTAAFILWHAGSPRLSDTVRAMLLQAPTRVIYVSAASAFEITTKVRLGKLVVPPALVHDFQYVVEADGFRMLDVNASAAIRAGQLAGDHGDPFDRLIAAQALELGAVVVTSGPAFGTFGVEVCW